MNRVLNPRRFSTTSSVLLAVLALLWVGGIALGFGSLWNYSRNPGLPAQVSALWPEDSRLSRVLGRNTLVLFAHPRCPCTRASLSELQEILPAAQREVTSYVVFLRPEGERDDWVKSDLWRKAGEMPGMRRVIDEDGREAASFGSQTSGQTLLYDRQGRLVFSGGITMARGHVGENEGRIRVLSLLKTGRASGNTTEVFGCGLQTPTLSGARSEGL